MSGKPDPAPSLAARLRPWFRAHGRHDLPWQHPCTPYRTWISEVMLQQTQVATVIPYFQRFTAALPTLPALAGATLDEVFALWSGLGYYRRARHLHAAAVQCMARHGGELPATLAALMALPGIGRSTAGAILSLAHDAPQPILDGNVKRVLCRHFGIAGAPSAALARRLWQLAEQEMPRSGAAEYTQALMDLGAIVCTPRQPRCAICPLRDTCLAHRTGTVAELPTPRASRRLPERSTCLLLVTDGAHRVLLEKRPPSGVWGGLWSLPEAADATRAQALADALGTRAPLCQGPAFDHVFTHFKLHVRVLHAQLAKRNTKVADAGLHRWFTRAELAAIGLPAPVRKLLMRTPTPPVADHADAGPA